MAKQTKKSAPIASTPALDTHPQPLQPAIIQTPEPNKKPEHSSWRAGIESTCTMFLTIFGVLAIPIFLMGQSYRKGYLGVFGAPDDNFPHDVTQNSLELTIAIPHFINKAGEGFDKQDFLDKFGICILIFLTLMASYFFYKFKERWDLKHPPKAFVPPSEKKQLLIFSLIALFGSFSPYILALVMLVVIVVPLEFINVFEFLGEDRARKVILRTKDELISPKPRNTLNMVNLVGESNPTASIECNDNYCIVVTCDAKTKVSIIRIVKRSAVTPIGKSFTEEQLAPKRK